MWFHLIDCGQAFLWKAGGGNTASYPMVVPSNLNRQSVRAFPDAQSPEVFA